MKAYPSYKASEYSWIGDLPSHWKFGKLKHFSHINPTKNSDLISKKSDDLVTFLPMEKVNADGTYELSLKRPLSELSSGFTYFELNDVIVAKITPCFENGKGALLSNLDGQIGFGSTEFHVLRALPEISRPKFLYYLTQSHLFRTTGEAFMYGAAGQKRVPTSHLTDFPFSCPPLSEQQAIADFLDRKTAQIDALIEKKQRQIDLLQEQRTALINHAVTKGLNPDVRMKDSGVEWLGEIPSHWEVLPLKRVVLKFVDYRGHTPVKTDSGVLLITAKNIKNGRLDFEKSKEYIAEDGYDSWMVRGMPEKGDVMVTTEAPLGATAQIEDENVALAQRLILLKADKEQMDNTFLKYYFLSQAGQDELYSQGTGSTAIGIKASKFYNINTIIPPLAEQKKIVEYIVNEESRILSFAKKTDKIIEFLQEYRTALISEAVTGKIDVRTADTVHE